MIPPPTDLFCHTILFAKFNMLATYILHFLANVEEAYTPLDFPLDQGNSVPPKSMEGLFLKAFNGS